MKLAGRNSSLSQVTNIRKILSYQMSTGGKSPEVYPC